MLRRSKTSQKAGVFQSKNGSGLGEPAAIEQLEGEINHWLGVKRAMFGEVLLQAGVIDADYHDIMMIMSYGGSKRAVL